MNPVLQSEINNLILNSDYETLDHFCRESIPMVVAESLSVFPPEDILKVISRQEPALMARIFCDLPVDVQLNVAGIMDNSALALLVTWMDPDDRVDFLKDLPGDRVGPIMRSLAKAEREDIRLLSSYEEGTAGSVMTSDYVALKASLTVKEATSRIRLEAPDKESIYYSYIIDDNRTLLGFISLKNIIMANPRDLLSQVMHDNIVSVGVNEDKHEAARIISRYDLIAVPVVDEENRIVGIITHDDAVDIIEEEHSDDLDMIAGLTNIDDDTSYLKTSVWSNYRSRVVWLALMVFMGLISGAVIQKFSDALSTMMILTVYIPMLGGTGGNSGSQASAVVIRALGTGSITIKNFFTVVWKEFRVSLLLALTLGILTFIRVYFFSGSQIFPPGINIVTVSVTIGLALAVQVITATILGGILPMIASVFKIDPAVVASPALSSIVDITGLLIYFNLARIVLGI